MPTPMTPRQRIEAIFRRQPVDGPIWQPRLEHWYNVNRVLDTLPPQMQGYDLRDTYDAVGAAIRAYHVFNRCLTTHEGEGVSVDFTDDGRDRTTVIRTPIGTVREVRRITEHGTSSTWVEHFIKSADDIPIVEYVYARRTYAFDEACYRQGDAWLGERGVPTLYLPRVPLQRLFVQLAGVVGTVYLLCDAPRATEHLMRTLAENDDILYAVVCQCPIWLINFGDNVHGQIASPRLFRRYLLPYYQQRTEQLHAAGKVCHAHWDGDVKPLLPFARATGLDGIEAITPLPQGDVTLAEVKEALGDMIWLDGIPMTHFLSFTPVETLVASTRDIIERFMPNLVLGISDELSPPGSIAKVKQVGEIVASYT